MLEKGSSDESACQLTACSPEPSACPALLRSGPPRAWGCMGLQRGMHGVAAWGHGVAAWGAHDCSLGCTGLQPGRLVLLEQVDQREVEGARASLLLLLGGEQPCRLLLQVRVQLADHGRAVQAAVVAAGLAALPPRVGEDAQAEVLIGDARLAH